MKTLHYFLWAALFSIQGWAAVVDRIQAPVDDRVRSVVPGHVPELRSALDQGTVDGSMPLPRITLFFNRTPAQQAELEALLQQQQDPSSPNYHRWLTQEEFAARFGVSEADMAKTAQWLQGQGFTIVERPLVRGYIAFSGTAAQVRAAFGTELHHYAVKGVSHFANSTDPSLPRALADVTLAIRGLHDFRPRARRIRDPRPKFTSSISGNHFITPDDFATLYHLKPLYDQGIDGSGQWVGVMGQTDIPLTDIATFRNLSGLPANPPVVKTIPNAVGGVSSSDITEADLDVEWAGAVARKATVVYVNAGTSPNLSAFDSLAYAINNMITVGNTTQFVPVLSISYGGCEASWTASDINNFTALFQQANAQGQTVVGPGGDSGAADCESVTATSATQGFAVDFPASSAFVTGIGGTMLNEGNNAAQYWASANNSFGGSLLSYVPETVWNETTANGGQIAAGGGGKSTMLINGNPNTKPAWQNALTPSDGLRDVPDISLAGGFLHDGFLICASDQSPADCTSGFRRSDTTLDAIGGTSAGVPTFAGMVVLLNQKMGAPPGNVNPMLYTLAANSTDAFHDITTGDNIVPCMPGSTDCPGSAPFQFGFTAVAGYDQASGLGTVDAYNLISELSSNTTSTPAAPDFMIGAAGSTTLNVTHGTSGMFTVTITPMNGFSGNVTFSCIVPVSLAGVTCTPPGPVSSGNATFTINASSTAKLMTPGPSRSVLASNWGGGILIAGLLLGAGERKKKGALGTTLLVGGLFLVLLVSLAGCGGGSTGGGGINPPPAGQPESGTVVLQGVSNADVHIVPITVNVN